VSVGVLVGVLVGIGVRVLTGDTAGLGGSMVARGVGEPALPCPSVPILPTGVGLTNVTPLRCGIVGVGAGNRKGVTLIAGVGKISGCGR
jgi:hypothetical protein